MRLTIIEDSGFLRTGLRVALEAGGEMDVVGEFTLGEEWAPVWNNSASRSRCWA